VIARENSTRRCPTARAEADAAEHPVVVAGSMGNGKMLERSRSPVREAEAAFAEQAGALVEAA